MIFPAACASEIYPDFRPWGGGPKALCRWAARREGFKSVYTFFENNSRSAPFWRADRL